MGPAFGDIFTLGCCLILERVRNHSGALTHSWNQVNTSAVAGGWKGGHLDCVALSGQIRVHWPDLCRPGVGSLTVEQGAQVCS